MPKRIAALLVVAFVTVGVSSINLSLGVSDCVNSQPEGLQPVAAYNFNDGGDVVRDRTCNGHTMTCTTCPSHGPADGPNSDGAYTHVFQTAGNEESFTIDGSGLDLDSNNAMTIAYDFKGTMAGLLAILLERTTQFKITGLLLPNATLFNLTDPGIPVADSWSTLGNETDGSWHQVVFVFNGATDTIKVYFDGAFETERTAIVGTLGSNTNDLHISGGGVAQFVASIDNLRLYDVALTLTEIQAIEGVAVAD